MPHKNTFAIVATLVFLLGLSPQLRAQTAAGILAELDQFPHTQRISFSESDVVDYEIGLGAIQKRSGVWGFKRSERLSGHRVRYTWQIVDGYDAERVLENVGSKLSTSSELLFSCESRGCGQGSQWANQVFGERLLYGRDEYQNYRVYGPKDPGAGDYRVLLFSAARLADRQYLHAELVTVSEPATPEE
ncbi:DUF4892 domain-containing protein [Haliea sp. E17]|uniref:DUF4892 domain-containing protein n=1 Tax=Haliea sp. E17 TaxID=3401576 RepID=UPI003AAD81E7